MQNYRILIVDDDTSYQRILREKIESLNTSLSDSPRYMSWVAGNYEEAEAQLNRWHFHLALIDLRLQKEVELEGKTLIQKIKELDEGTSTIVITGFADATIATELLKEYDVFYLFEKGKPLTALVEQIQKAIPKAQNEYDDKFNSAMDFLKGNQDFDSWAAEALQAILGTSRVSSLKDRNNLRKLLDSLLAGLYPLLFRQEDGGTIISGKDGMVGAHCWSKALGGPVFIKFGLQERLNAETESVDTDPNVSVQRIFAQIERTRMVEELGGVVYIPMQPSFAEFRSAQT